MSNKEKMELIGKVAKIFTTRGQLADWDICCEIVGLVECSNREAFHIKAVSSKPRKNNKSGYKGLTWDESRQQWYVQINLKRHGMSRSKFLGRFDDEVRAARAYDQAAKKFHGDKAYLNFPETRKK
jgi:hypothetical protein